MSGKGAYFLLEIRKFSAEIEMCSTTNKFQKPTTDSKCRRMNFLGKRQKLEKNNFRFIIFSLLCTTTIRITGTTRSGGIRHGATAHTIPQKKTKKTIEIANRKNNRMKMNKRRKNDRN